MALARPVELNNLFKDVRTVDPLSGELLVRDGDFWTNLTNAPNGLLLKDDTGNYWRLSIDSTGALVTTSLGPDPEPPAGLSDLTLSLSAAWEYENSGNLGLDSHTGGRHLTNNGAGQTTGKVGSGALALPGSVYLSRADEAAFRIVGGIWFASWVYLTGIGTPGTWLGKGTAGAYEYAASFDPAAGRFKFQAYTGAGGNAGIAVANTLGAVSAGTWYHLLAYYDPGTARVGISGNGGAFDTTAVVSLLTNGASPLNLGRMPDPSSVWNGRLDSTFFGNGYLPTLADSVWLYNGGAGRTHAELAAH